STVIVHLGAVSGVVACARDPEATRRTNVEATAHLAEWCERHRVPLAFASSLAVVGAPSQMPITEETPTAPTHEYARQKADGEKIVERLARTGVPAIAVRMSNVYGSYSTEGRLVAKGNVLNEFARQSSDRVLRVNAPGTQRRDFIHVEDVVQGWLRLATRLADGPVPQPRLLFASGRSLSVKEVADLVARTWSRIRPGESTLSVQVVENPRGAIELLDERFEVEPSTSWKTLGVAPQHRLEKDIESLLSPGASPG
ncbi:MAG: NAD-dependent epimerase/dehydratase family protein, partial [Thermoplasmata archaeon]